MKQLIECVPNISEGNNSDIIKQITDEIEAVEHVRILNVDSGKATNRTVLTFVGPPEQVCKAAFNLIKTASQLIDMSKHEGEHPRIGATDVCPLVPISGITMHETVKYARELSKRVGEELNIPVYNYEFAASDEKRRNLANCRSGEYEGLYKKMIQPEWKPDYGPAVFNKLVAKTGATIIGTRNFLIAYNINLNTDSSQIAKNIAAEIREKGHIKRDKDTGKIITDENGNTVYEPGMLKCLKGIGWYIKEYGIAQLSFNLTDITVTSLHHVFEAASEKANAKGIRVTGSELIGLVPLNAILDAGKHFLKKQNKTDDIPEIEIINKAVKSLGLDELAPFNPQKRIIEYLIQ